MRRTTRALALAGISIAATFGPMTMADARSAAPDESTPESWDQAGPYDSHAECEYWRDYYAVFYTTEPCYKSSTSPFWYFLYCCI